MPLNACFPNIAPNLRKLGEGPDKNMAAPSAILSTRRGLRLNRAPPVWLGRFLVLRFLVLRFLVLPFLVLLLTRFFAMAQNQ